MCDMHGGQMGGCVTMALSGLAVYSTHLGLPDVLEVLKLGHIIGTAGLNGVLLIQLFEIEPISLPSFALSCTGICLRGEGGGTQPVGKQPSGSEGKEAHLRISYCCWTPCLRGISPVAAAGLGERA